MFIRNKTVLFRLTISILLLYSTIDNVSAQDINQIQLANEYYSMGDVEKALDMYEKLAKNS